MAVEVHTHSSAKIKLTNNKRELKKGGEEKCKKKKIKNSVEMLCANPQ